MKLEEEKIARLTRKREQRPARSLAKSFKSEEEKKTSLQIEASDEEVHLKKGGKLKNGESPSLMTIETIQDLITNAIKAQLRGGGCRLTCTSSLTLRGLMGSTCPWLPTSKIPTS